MTDKGAGRRVQYIMTVVTAFFLSFSLSLFFLYAPDCDFALGGKGRGGVVEWGVGEG